MRWLYLLPLAASACVDMQDNSSSIVGTSGDVATAPGDYVGYRVVTPCESTYVNVGVVGTGSVHPADVDELSTEFSGSIRDISSVWGSGAGLGCEPGIGLVADTNDWRDVDRLIVRAGEFLHDRDLALQVSISVGGIPRPVRQ